MHDEGGTVLSSTDSCAADHQGWIGRSRLQSDANSRPRDRQSVAFGFVDNSACERHSGASAARMGLLPP